MKAGFVSLIGRPNVGKSTLLNQLLQQKLVITSHKPQTTRHNILGIASKPEAQIIYIDTPGIHQRGNKALNRYLNRTAQSALVGVHLIVFVVDSDRWHHEDEQVYQRVRSAGLPVILAVNKVDTIKPKSQLLPLLERLHQKTGFDDLIPISARTGDNCDALEQKIIELLPESEPIYPEDQISDRPERFFMAELIREQITRRYHKELPYSVSVEIESCIEEPRLYRIAAVIWVERPSQKAILLGKRGEALKETATQARLNLEEFLQKKVFLQLWIKVKKSWSADEHSLNQLGYSD